MTCPMVLNVCSTTVVWACGTPFHRFYVSASYTQHGELFLLWAASSSGSRLSRSGLVCLALGQG